MHCSSQHCVTSSHSPLFTSLDVIKVHKKGLLLTIVRCFWRMYFKSLIYSNLRFVCTCLSLNWSLPTLSCCKLIFPMIISQSRWYMFCQSPSQAHTKHIVNGSSRATAWHDPSFYILHCQENSTKYDWDLLPLLLTCKYTDTYLVFICQHLLIWSLLHIHQKLARGRARFTLALPLAHTINIKQQQLWSPDSPPPPLVLSFSSFSYLSVISNHMLSLSPFISAPHPITVLACALICLGRAQPWLFFFFTITPFSPKVW